MKQKVLILGAKGMLGQELVAQFAADEKYEVIGWDRDEIDITNAAELEEKIKSLAPQIIINAVGYNAVDKVEESEEEFQLAMQLNAEAPERLAQIAKDIGAVFVQYVTDYLFDGVKGEYTEEDEKNPISRYGVTKSLGEDKVKAVGGDYYLIRISKLFGNPGAAETAKKSFFALMAGLAETNKTLKVVDSEKSCFTYVPDLAQATKKLIEEKYPFGIYHLVNEGAVTWFEGLKKYFELVGINDVEIVPIKSEDYPRSAKRADSTVLINTKFPKLRNYEDAIKEWIKNK